MNAVFRLVCDPPRPAALNMAIDEALFEAMRERPSEPVLRFYEWDRASTSVGYFQSTEGHTAPVVRRLTGGGAVTHGRDLTFSLILPVPNAYLSSNARDSYLKVNEALRTGLREIYPSIDYASCKDLPSPRSQAGRACFDAPVCTDLMLGPKKVVGSSQRRTREALLHQSSVVLDSPRAVVEQAVRDGFARLWGVSFLERGLSSDELGQAGTIAAGRYARSEWARV